MGVELVIRKQDADQNQKRNGNDAIRLSMSKEQATVSVTSWRRLCVVTESNTYQAIGDYFYVL